MARMPNVSFVPPRSYTIGRPAGQPRLLVIHYTAGSENRTSAEDGASYDQRRQDGTSAHFFTDSDSIVQCVDTENRSHTARYYGNLYGIHIEQCGTQQTRAQWLDFASRPTITNTARVCAWVMRNHSIPLARLVNRQVRTGTGICGHQDVTVGFPEDDGDHMDPDGSRIGSYPWDILFTDIGKILAPRSRSAAPSMTLPTPWPMHTQTVDARKIPANKCLVLCAGTGGSQDAAAEIQSLWVDYFVFLFRRFSPGYWNRAVARNTKVLLTHEIDGPLLDTAREMAEQILDDFHWSGCITSEIWDIYQPASWGANY